MERLPAHSIQPSTVDGQILGTVAGETEWVDAPEGGGSVEPGSGTAILVPLTTVIDGVPQLVWTEDNQLVLTEETL